MTLNAARVGHRYPAYRYEVSREKVREYARTTRAEAGLDAGSDFVPPTFAACFTLTQGAELVANDSALGAHPRLVHNTQDFVFHRPLRVGDHLVCTPWIEEIISRGRMEFLTLGVRCEDATSGAPVVTSLTRILFLTPAGGGGRGGRD